MTQDGSPIRNGADANGSIPGSGPSVGFDPEGLDEAAVYKIMAGTIVPRPIGFISTMARDGVLNAAPFSFFNMLSHAPPMVSVSIAGRMGARKDTLANIEQAAEFVVNIVNEAIVERVDRCSEFHPPEVDEIALNGLHPEASTLVKPPRIAESPVSFECRLDRIVDLRGSLHTLVLARVVWMHVDSKVLLPNHRIDHAALGAIGRMTGNSYCRTSDTFTLAHDGLAALARKSLP